jgi:tetratricopeptide (TPR) repeat protein
VALKFYPKLAAAVALAALCVAAVQAQPKDKKVKDQAEYDLTQAINKETDPNKQMQLLQQWKEKYADSDFKVERAQMICQGYQKLAQAAKMWDSCGDLVALDPKNFLGLYFLTSLTPSMNDSSASKLDAGEKYTRSFMAVAEEMKKPDPVSENDFNAQKKAYRSLGLRTLGWIDYARKSWDKAEDSLTTFLKFNPNSGNASYWLATSMLQQKKKEKQLPALYHLARAAHYKGEDELVAAAKTQLQAFLDKTYLAYTGEKDGLKDLIALALKGPFPPDGFTIESAQEKIAKMKNQMREKEPEKFFWVGLKEALQDPAQGAKYFEESMKDSALLKLKGKVVEFKPATRPKEIMISILIDGVPEIKLRVDPAFANKAEPGTELEFEGAVAKEFTADPFVLTLEIEREKVAGWPKPVATPKAGGAKKAATKK